FPGTKYTTNTLRWTWSDGAFAPPTPKRLGLPEDFELPNQGSYFVGERGSMLLPHIAEPRLFPEDAFVDYKMPNVEDGNHYHQWVDACLGKGQTSADFSYASALTESLLLGVVANRFPDVELQWNARTGKVTNVPAANELLRDNYRDGFAVDNL
ncbi:MAG: gfo/Idh/MocA family oxidoreductase, partial [Planctomycetaceae bacterium]|nr:gfo/Idh/MocA family oxidoreductase [Planctomycetaceae bacterium]